ncbi:MAG: hypothetical protein HY897_11810 [Deltaproteobacteria bacterium]|nr:hypothetical protein [Deltaproteobacteria bacterium]
MNQQQHETVRQILVDNARRISVDHQVEIESWDPVKPGGNFLPAYIPYIGADYFSPRTKGCRILAYALSQNISKSDGFAVEWAHDWKEGTGTVALDRQNQNGGVAMHPFATGHIPILAYLLRSLAFGRKPGDGESIFWEIAATNLSKFSFRSSNGKWTTDNYTSLRRCWEWFSRLEVEQLDPDFILCCDHRVYNIVQVHVPAASKKARVILVAFPSLRVINRHYRKTRFHEGHLRAPQIKERIAAVDLDRSVDHGRTISQVIDRDEYYFAEMFARMETAFSVIASSSGAT